MIFIIVFSGPLAGKSKKKNVLAPKINSGYSLNGLRGSDLIWVREEEI